PWHAIRFARATPPHWVGRAGWGRGLPFTFSGWPLGSLEEVVLMPKYLYMGCYTRETWTKLLDNPEDRTAAVQKLAEAVGGRLESIYWAFGADDFVVIAEAPDDTAAAAISLAVGASGSVENVRTVKLI